MGQGKTEEMSLEALPARTVSDSNDVTYVQRQCSTTPGKNTIADG